MTKKSLVENIEGRYLRMKWKRSKRGKQREYTILPNSGIDFEVCALHAIAEVLAGEDTLDESLFSCYSGGSDYSTHELNNILKEIENGHEHDSDPYKPERYTKGLTNHSLRRLSLARMENDRIPADWHDARAGMSTSKNNTKMQHYWHGTDHTDLACALALAQWKSHLGGGRYPDLTQLPKEIVEQMDQFFAKLFMNCPTVDIYVKRLLGSIILRD